MAYRALVSIGSYDFPEPSSYDANTADIVDSARNVAGYVVGAVIRYDVAKITMKWRYLTVQQWAGLLQKFKISSGGSFYNDVTFFNQSTGAWETRTMYVSDRNAGMMWRNQDHEPQAWLDATMSLVEV